MSAKLLVHLVESIFKISESDQSKGIPILNNIMHTFVLKITALSKFIIKFNVKDKQNIEHMDIKDNKESTEDEDSSCEAYLKKDNSVEISKNFRCK
jgi:hypothetical protein